MMRHLGGLALLLLVAAGPAAGQTIAGDRFTLNTGPCTIRSGAGAPEGAVTGKVCDIYIRTDGSGAAIIYVKDAGTGAAGWQTITPGIPGDPVPGKVLTSGAPVVWTSTPSLTGITGAADLTLNPAGDLVLGPAGRDVLPGTGYAVTVGALARKYLAVHAAELWAETLVAQNTMATIGGRVLVAPTNILARDVAPADTVIYVKYPSFLLHVPGVEHGSKLFLEAAGKFEVMRIIDLVTPPAAADGAYGYTVERDIDGSGLNLWYAGDAILDTGKATGGAVSGLIDLYSVRGILSGAGPAIVGRVRTGGAYDQLSPRWAVGNLNGVGYGHVNDQYGLAAGDPAGPNFFVDSANGLHLRQGTTPYVSLNPNGTVTIRGDGSGVTNINGGQIAADSITGAQIAANSITVGDLNVSGFGENLIKNGTFEPTPGFAYGHESGIAGWSKDLSSAAEPITNSCCGVNGGGTLWLAQPNGQYMSAVYLAFPIQPGETYRVSLWVYSSQATGVGTHVLVYEANLNAGAPRYIRNPGASVVAPDVAGHTYQFLALNAPLVPGWQRLEYLYTAPASSNWASLALYSHSGTASGSVYTTLHFDDVEFERQIGPGHIRARSLTADRIVAGSLTATEVAARAITADRIAVGSLTSTEIAARGISADRIVAASLTATEIAARAITADRIAVGVITATEIAGGTITGDRIAANTIGGVNIGANSITADKLSVGSLSAISANLGTVTAGTINGVNISGTTITGSSIYGNTIYAGGGNEIVLDNNGLAIATGNGTGAARIRLGGASIWADANNVNINWPTNFEQGLTIYGGAQLVHLNPPSFNQTPVSWWSSCNCYGRGTSSARYKENIRPWAPDAALDVLRLPLVSFDYRADARVPVRPPNEIGVLAEDVARWAPRAVILDAGGRPDAVSPLAFSVYLLAALQAEDRRVGALEAAAAIAALRVSALEKRIAALEAAAAVKR